LVEHQSYKLGVVGSNPAPPTTLRFTNYAWCSHDSTTKRALQSLGEAWADFSSSPSKIIVYKYSKTSLEIFSSVAQSVEQTTVNR
jgi:hypothetical protein